MILRSEGNQLFFDNEEVREWACSRGGSPAHDHRITCIGSSPTGARIVTADEVGKIRVWDPSKPNLEKRVWNGNGFQGATAVGVTEDGKRLTVAVGLSVSVYDLEPNQSRRLETATVPLKEKVTCLQFGDEDHVTCVDGDGKRCILKRDPSWKVTPDK